MEQVLERKAKTEERKIYDWRDIEMYYDDGRRITNPEILMGMAEAQEIAEAWERRMESYNLEEVFGGFEDDTEEENH